MALDDPVHFAHLNDGEDTVWRPDLAGRGFGHYFGRHLRVDDLGRGKNLPHGHPDVRKKTFLQGNLQVAEVQITEFLRFKKRSEAPAME